MSWLLDHDSVTSQHSRTALSNDLHVVLYTEVKIINGLYEGKTCLSLISTLESSFIAAIHFT